ncbi:HD domain-containing protein [Neobacillus sp. LXY-4]|uniref:HD domain-containing protein n=1 Tax=Neobacillus sp. LXY-4 TaxID=3379826 RepID=UPI003EE116BF
MKNEIINKTELFVKKVLGQDSTGHDWYHVDRVRKNALHIADYEKAGDRFVIEMAALLHDVPDEKLNESEEVGFNKLYHFLDQLPLNQQEKDQIINIISTISYKGGQTTELSSLEAKIVQDADRLDAIGAIGIARTFAYGGKKGQPLYDPALQVRSTMTLEEYRNGKSSSIHHFYEKLLKLKDKLNTESAKQMAEKRHQTMEHYLELFFSEWNGQQ